MKYLITGITGMIGSHVARTLVDRGDEVYGLVRWRSNLRNLSGILERIRLQLGDIQEEGLVRRLLARVQPDIIFHFAAQAFNGVSWDSPRYTLMTNIEGTLNILEALREQENRTTRVLMGCSSTEYGDTSRTWKGPLSEEAPLRPVTPYGVSKVAQELLGNQYYLCYGIPVVTARVFNQLGTGHTESAAIQEFSRQIAMIEAGIQEPVMKVGYLGAKRDYCDIRDTAPVFIRLAEEGVVGEAYNIASGNAVSMQDLLEMLLTMTRMRIEVRHDDSRERPYDEQVLVGDNSKIRALTGWVPRTDYRNTLSDILEYWRTEISLRYRSGRDR